MAGRKGYHSPATLKKGCDEYFKKADGEATPAGLLLHLKINRRRWSIYEGKPKLASICEWAKLKLEHEGTLRLYKKGRVADIFFLKNMGWTDKQEFNPKDNALIGKSITDEQARAILERFTQRLTAGQSDGGADSEAGETRPAELCDVDGQDV